MPKRSKRLRKLIANGGTPFTCSQCDRVFASTRDLSHHLTDAHNSMRLAIRAEKEKAMSQRHHHQQQASVTHLHSRQPETHSGGFRALFSGKKAQDELFVVDFTTPLDKILCRKPKCKAPAIPLTGFCIAHDPLCICITLGRKVKAEAEAAKETEKKRLITDAPRGLVLFGERHDTADFPDREPGAYSNGYDVGEIGYGGTAYERLMN